MSAFLPNELGIVVALAVVLLVLLLGGYVLTRNASGGWVPKLGWAILVPGSVGIERLVADQPAGARMLALIAFALLTLKFIVVATERATGMRPLAFPAWLAFTGAWLGMRPRPFTTYGQPALDGAGALLSRGARNAALGVGFVALARAVWFMTGSRFAATILALVGLSLVLHFGIGTLLAAAWRLQGVAADAVFRAPLHSQSLAEFWSRRWNLGFSEMTAQLVYRPLVATFGRSAALLFGFIWSGLLHELAISVPVRAGFGLPTLYFLLQGGLVWFERRLSRAGHPLRGARGRAWSLFWLVAPLPLLFHPPFIAGIVAPLIGIPAAHG